MTAGGTPIVMGILRLYLALCVVAAHSGLILPWRMHDGRQAVQVFYIISGFYMALVLSTRYKSAKAFYESRFLRIFPTYWIVLLLTIAASMIAGWLSGDWLALAAYADGSPHRNGAVGVLLSALSNLTLFGQDAVMFLQHEGGQSLRFHGDLRQLANPLYHYLIVPQCWSVGLELTFYCVVPFLNRLKTGWLAGLAGGMIAARLFAYWRLGLAHDPWTYRFFPFELSLFLFGMLGYRLYAWTTRRYTLSRFRCSSRIAYFPAGAVLLAAFYGQTRVADMFIDAVGPDVGVLLTYPIWGLALPVIFFIFGEQRDDRIIGELSYPVYLVHLLVIDVLALVLKRGDNVLALGVPSAIVAVAFSAAFYFLFIAPMDRRRHVLASRLAAAAPR